MVPHEGSLRSANSSHCTGRDRLYCSQNDVSQCCHHSSDRTDRQEERAQRWASQMIPHRSPSPGTSPWTRLMLPRRFHRLATEESLPRLRGRPSCSGTLHSFCQLGATHFGGWFSHQRPSACAAFSALSLVVSGWTNVVGRVGRHQPVPGGPVLAGMNKSGPASSRVPSPKTGVAVSADV